MTQPPSSRVTSSLRSWIISITRAPEYAQSQGTQRLAAVVFGFSRCVPRTASAALRISQGGLSIATRARSAMLTRLLTAPGRSVAMACQLEVAHGHPDQSGPGRPRPRARGGDRRRGRRDRAHAAHPRGVAGAAACLAAVPHAAAALGGRRRDGACALRGGDRRARPARRLDRVERIRRQQFRPDRRLSGARGQSRRLRRSAQHRGLGTSKRFARERGRRQAIA